MPAERKDELIALCRDNAARKIEDVRETLRKALWEEQLGLHAMLVGFIPVEESRE